MEGGAGHTERAPACALGTRSSALVARDPELPPPDGRRRPKLDGDSPRRLRSEVDRVRHAERWLRARLRGRALPHERRRAHLALRAGAVAGNASRLERVTISFARGIPSPECLPVEELADCAREALRRDGETILSYGSTLGYEPLREWIGDRHGVEAERVVVTNGSLQAFHLVLSALGPGTVAVERPTYDRPREILVAEGREVAEIPIDDEGLDVDTFAAERSAALLYTIPTFQNPTGVTLSEQRRERLAALVRDRELPVLEDDPYGLVRFDGQALPTL